MAWEPWNFEPLWLKNERKRRALYEAQQAAQPYLRSGKPADLEVANQIVGQTTAKANPAKPTADSVIQQMFNRNARTILDTMRAGKPLPTVAPRSVTPKPTAPVQVTPVQPDQGDPRLAAFDSIKTRDNAPFGADVRPDVSASRALGQIAQVSAEAAPSSFVSEYTKPLTDKLPAGDLINGAVAGIVPWLVGLGPLDAAMRAGQAYRTGGPLGLTTEAVNAGINQFGIPGTGPLASRLAKLTGEQVGKVLATAGLNAATAAGTTAALDYANTGKVDTRNLLTQTFIAGGIPVAHGIIGGLRPATRQIIDAAAQGHFVPKVPRPFGNRIIEDQAAGDALVHQIELDTGVSTAPLSAAEQRAMARLVVPDTAYQPSFAEAIPAESKITGTPIRWTNRGQVPGVGETGYAEYFGAGSHGFEKPAIYVNDAILSRPPSSARDFLIRARVIPHEEAHAIWNEVLTPIQQERVGKMLYTGEKGAAGAVRNDLQTRWGQQKFDAPQEAFAEAWASRQSSQETPYSRLLGPILDEVLGQLSPEQRGAVNSQRRQMRDWTPKLTAAMDSIATGMNDVVPDASVNTPWWWVRTNAGEDAGFITSTSDGRYEVGLRNGERQTFKTWQEAQQYAAKARNLMPSEDDPVVRALLGFDTGGIGASPAEAAASRMTPVWDFPPTNVWRHYSDSEIANTIKAKTRAIDLPIKSPNPEFVRSQNQMELTQLYQEADRRGLDVPSAISKLNRENPSIQDLSAPTDPVDEAGRVFQNGVPDPTKPTFLGMQPSEIADILGVPAQNKPLYDRLLRLDEKFRLGSLTAAEARERANASTTLRKYYSDLNDGRSPVWVLPAGSREAWMAGVQKRVDAMRSAGWSDAEIQAAIPDAPLAGMTAPQSSQSNPQGSHTAAEYLGQAQFRRMLQLEKIASNPGIDAETRTAARQQLHVEFGGQDEQPAQTSAPASLEDQLSASLAAQEAKGRTMQSGPKQLPPGVADVANDQIKERPELFQGRDADPGKTYNEAKVRGIVDNYDPLRMEPGLLVRDTSSGDLVVVRGHHRLEAQKRMAQLGELPDSSTWQIVEADLGDAKQVAAIRKQALLSNYGSRATNVREDLRAVKALKDEGADAGSIASQMGIPPAQADDLLQLSTLPQDIIDNLARTGSDYGNVAEVARVANTYSLNEAETRALVKRYGPGGQGAKISRPQVRDALEMFAADFRGTRASQAQMGFDAAVMGDANVAVLDNIDRMVGAQAEIRRQQSSLQRTNENLRQFASDPEYGPAATQLQEAIRQKVKRLNEDLAAQRESYNAAKLARLGAANGPGTGQADQLASSQTGQPGETAPPAGASLFDLGQVATKPPAEPPRPPWDGTTPPQPSDSGATGPTLPGMEPAAPSRFTAGNAWAVAKDVLNAPRATLSSLDASQTLRQNYILGIQHPGEFRQSIVDSVKAWKSAENAAAMQKARQADSDYGVLKDAGWYERLYGEQAQKGPIENRDEKFMSSWVGKIPGLRASERSFSEGVNSLTWAVSKGVLAEMRAAAPNGLVDAAALRRRIELINAMAGRGKIPKELQSGALNATFFSPRFLASRVQLAGAMLSRDPAVKRDAAKAMAGFIGVNTAILGMAAAAGASGIIPGLSVGLDPAKNLGKVTLGNTSYDFWAGYAPLVRFVYQLATNDAGYGNEQSKLTTLGKFAQGKLAPVPGAVLDVLRGENPTGTGDFEANPSGIGDTIYRAAAPIFLQQVADALKSGDVDTALKQTPDFVGIGTNTYTPRTQQLDEQAQSLAKANPDDYPDGVSGFYDLQPKDRQAIKDQHPDLWKAYMANASGNSAAAETVRTELAAKQELLDQQLLSGNIPADQWMKQYQSLRDELRYRSKQIYSGTNTPNEMKTPLDRYYHMLDGVTDGTLTWDDVDAWMAQQPAADQKYIEQNTGLGGTPLVRAVKQYQNEYYDLPKYRGFSADEGSAIDELAGYARSYATNDAGRLAALNVIAAKNPRAYSPRVVAAARRMLIDPNLGPQEDVRRTRYKKQHPAMAALMGNGFLNPRELTLLKRQIGA